jgi:hypothetical protein
MNYSETKQYIGNREQLFSVRESRLVGGRADGVRVVDIQNGGNLSLTVAVDRCMDIPVLRYKGRCVNYVTCNSLSHPAYYEVTGEGWSEAFSGGFLYTCGLSNTGLRSGTDWDAQKEHGCIANRPAEHLNLLETETDDGPAIELVGTMKEGMLAGANLTLTRSIRVSYRRDIVEITDVVKNEGFRRVPQPILYHCNMGYPLLQPDSRFFISHSAVRPRTPFAEQELSRLNEILPPQDAMEEACYYYTPVPDKARWTTAVLENAREGIRLQLSFDTSTLDHFVQWKNFVKGEYIMGLEPANASIDGREDAISRGELPCLDGGESRVYRLRFELDDGN